MEDVCIVCSCMIETGGLCMVCTLRSSETMKWMAMPRRLCIEHRISGQAWLGGVTRFWRAFRYPRLEYLIVKGPATIPS